MNAPALHLDLEELLAGTGGQPVNDRAREHLVACGHCAAEAARWEAVAGGVHALMAAAPEAPPLHRHGRGATLTHRNPRAVLAASVVAGLIAVGGAGYGLTTALTRSGPAGTGEQAVTLASVSGCPDLKAAIGTLEQVNGTSLVIKTASSGEVSVTTSASTGVNVPGALSDITNGETAGVVGTGSDEAVTAQDVIIQKSSSFGRPVGTAPGLVTVQGTVQDAGASSFTLVTSTGTQVAVTTSSQTEVDIPQATLAQLRTGAFTVAIGQVASDGTLKAVTVGQPGSGFSLSRVQMYGCTPSALNTAVTTAVLANG